MDYNGYSEMMAIDVPGTVMHQPENGHKNAGEVANELVDSVMGSPAFYDTRSTSSGHQARVIPASVEMAEAILPQDTAITESPSVQALCASYAESFPAPSKIGNEGFDYTKYFDPTRMTKVRAKHGPRLEKAKEFAIALLEHYYPKEQSFRVEPVEFPLLQFGGWRTWVYPEDCYSATKRKADNMKAGLKKNAKPVYETWSGDINTDKFHRILPEHITGYVVLNEVQYEDGSKGWAQHTYMAIMMDELDTFEHWVPEKFMCPDKNFISMPRADILSDAMGSQADISNGYAIIMLGPRIEFYNYQAKPAWQEKPWEHYLGPDPENDPDYDPDPEAGEETSCFSHLDGHDVDSDAWMVDIRSSADTQQTLTTVDKLFKSVVGRTVEYRGGYSLPGPEN